MPGGGACPVGRLPTLPSLYPPGGLPSLPPTAPAFSLIFCPHPPDPLPLRGRGRLLVFLCKGLRPLHPRGWMGRGTGSTCVWRCLAGGLPYLPPAAPAFSFVSCPHPPTPLPLRGRGRFFSFLMQGAPPLASPGLDGTRHWLDLRWRCLAGGLPGWSPADLAAAVPAGGLALFAACRPCL